ncbi:hypothetical protein Tco_0427951 [Tanacetum coccineum]
MTLSWIRQEGLCDEFEKLMKDKFQMSSMGELTFFLGLQVQQKKKGSMMYLTPPGQISWLQSVHVQGFQDSPLELVAYTDSDYAGATQDRKSTTRGCQFLGNSYALTKKPDIYISFIKQFWRTAKASTDTDREVTITAIIDGQSKAITEASLRRHLKLDDHDGITSIPNSKIFEQLALMGYQPDSDKLTSPTPESSPTPSSSPSRITSSPSLSSEPSTKPTFEPQPSPDAEIRVLEDDLKRKKQTYSTAFTKFILRIKTRKARKRARVVLSEDEEDNSSKQGKIDEDPNTYFHLDDEVDDDVVHDTAEERQPEDSTAGIEISTAPINDNTASESLSTTGKETRKYKGKAIMTEPEPEKKSKKLLEQDRLGLEEAFRLQEQVDEEEKAQTTKDIDWNDPSTQKYWDLKNKPKSEAQARKNMIVYLKNQSNYKMKDFEGMSYDEIRAIFEKKDTSKKTTRKRKKYLPRRRTRSTAKKQKVEQDDEKEELKNYLDIVPREDVAVDVESLSTKYPIMDWKTYTLSENFMYYKIIIGDGSLKNYKILSEMLYDFDRQDVVELYRLVKERYSSSKPEGYDLMLWGDLHTLFEPDEESEIWMNQNEYNLISWSLCDFYGVHILLMQNGIAIHMLTEKKYPLSQEMISKMLSKRLEVDQESTQAYELLKFIRSQVKK